MLEGCVCRALPEGEIDVEVADIWGTRESEVIDDGNNVVTENQLRNKYDGLVERGQRKLKDVAPGDDLVEELRVQ